MNKKQNADTLNTIAYQTASLAKLLSGGIILILLMKDSVLSKNTGKELRMDSSVFNEHFTVQLNT